MKKERKGEIMKIIFNRAQIITAVTPLMCAVSGKSTLSTIEGILIEAKMPDTCVFTTFDLEKGFRTKIDADLYEAGSYIISGQRFHQIIQAMHKPFQI